MSNILRSFTVDSVSSRYRYGNMYSPLDVEKYVEKVQEVNGDSISPATQFKMDLYLEIEKQRRKNCESNEKSELWKMTSWCASGNMQAVGQCGSTREHTILNVRCPVFCTIRSYNSTPYSVVLSDGIESHASIDFQPHELIGLLTSIKKLIRNNTEGNLSADMYVWGGRDTVRVTRRLEDYCEEGCECALYGIAIGQINFNINRKRFRDVGLSDKLIPISNVESLYISHESVNRLIHIMEKTCAVL